MTLTDKIIFFAAIILLWRGFNKGFLRTIFGPVAFLVCSAISYSYYIFTHDLVVAIAIGVIAPIVLNVLFSILLNLLSGGKERGSISLISRIIAALFNFAWGEFIIIVVLVTVLMLPFDLPSLHKVQHDIENSSVYDLVKPTVDGLLKSHHIQPDPAKISALSDPEKLKDVEKTAEYQALVSDPRIQTLINDPDVIEQIENRQIAQVMQNPKFLELTRDPELLKKFLALYSKMLN
jgi:uncharacterized membrane protein required for colicin V production